MGKTVIITMREIEKTDAYKGLSGVQKKLTQNKATIKHIAHGVNVSLNIGFEKWDAQTNFNHVNGKIVKEIVELKTAEKII